MSHPVRLLLSSSMRGSTIVAGLLSAAAVAEARSWQHVGKKQQNKHARSDPNALNNYLASRAVPEPRFANSNTTSKCDYQGPLSSSSSWPPRGR